MTFLEVYNSVIMRLWGDTTPPTSAVTFLQGVNGLIANAHRKVQQDYNYWFMRSYTTWETVAETNGYGLPVNFKELISLQFKVHDEDYFHPPLSPLKLTDPFTTQWPFNKESTEYPKFFELVANNIVLYPAPSEVRTLHLIFWTFFPRPAAAMWIPATTDSDSVTLYMGDILSYIAASDYSLIMKEYDQAQVYSQKALELTTELKQEDFRRRQAIIANVQYEEF